MKTCIRYLAVIFTVVMIVCALSSVSAGFPDVKNDNKHLAAIETMTGLGILGGYEDGSFRPNGLVTRAEMAKIVYVTATTYIDAGEGTLAFPDVAEKNWAKGYISWCVGKKIVGGYENGEFRPAGNITYDEALKMVCAMLGYTDFNPGMWPVDVRIKGITDLGLGKGLEDVTGSTKLTRAQVVQLVYNAFDKPMYAEIKYDDDGNVLSIPDEKTLKADIWQIEEGIGQIVATENYGLIDEENSINATKMGDKDTIVVHVVYPDGTTDDIEYQLSELGLEAYSGKTDSLLAFKINFIFKKNSTEFMSCELKGIYKDGVTTAGAPYDTLPASKVFGTSEKLAKYGISIGDVNHYDENFLKIRRLTWYGDKVLVTNPKVDADGNVIDSMCITYTGSAGNNRWCQNLYPLTQPFKSSIYTSGIDADSDGYYDYITYEYQELFRVTNVTSTTITFQHLYKSSWLPTPAYTSQFGTGFTMPALDLTFDIEDVATLNPLKVGSIVLGYPLGETFNVLSEAEVTTGYATKYSPSSSAITLDNGTTLTGFYAYWKLWISYAEEGVLSNFTSSMNPLIGLNSANKYNYAKYWSIDNKFVYAEKITEEEAAEFVTGGENVAILLYVTEATEPQINEANKQYEIFYPAYLMIDGRTQLVNLNPDNAIDGLSGNYVSQEGPYRAEVINDNGIQRPKYPNILVSYTINNDGYYTLTTTTQSEGDMVYIPNEDGHTYTVSMEKSTGIISIKKDGIKLNYNIIAGTPTMMYYTYTKPEVSGAYVYLDYYTTRDLPKGFAETSIASDIYLTRDSETGFYFLDTLMLGAPLGEVITSDKYLVDAREHLFANGESSAVLEGEKIYNSYNFKNLYTYEDVAVVNKKSEYSESAIAELNKIYAWSDTAKKYVEVTSSCASFKDSETVTEIINGVNVIFTTSYTEGVAIDDTVKIVAVTDKETAETKLITFAELVEVYKAIEEYNTLYSASEVLNVTIGTYVEDNETKIAYLVLDWVEYNADHDNYTFAGETR